MSVGICHSVRATNLAAFRPGDPCNEENISTTSALVKSGVRRVDPDPFSHQTDP